MKEEDFLTYNNTKQHIYIFDEVENPKGIVQIIHGMQESMKTYFDFAKFLNQHGYAVVGLDLRAHGKTAGDLSQIGVCRETLFKNIVQDQIFLSKMIKSKSSLPLYVFGHSYGSFILQRYIQLYSGYEKVILCGSSYMKKPLIRFGKFMAGLFCAFGGAHKKAHLIENMSFNSYQKKFKTGSWITSDEEEAKKFYDDEIGELCDTINYMAGELGNAEKMKNDFISSVSHELRTPLTAIKGWAETMQMGGSCDAKTMEKGLKIIVNESERLSGIVEELLDFSRIQNNRMVLKMDKIDILAEIDEAIYMLRERALSENKHLIYEEPEILPAVLGDKNRLRQVFINIIDKARKYTPEGGIINIEVSQVEENIVIKISDNGCGIPARHLSKVKEKFYKANQTQRGSGIGLAVADEIVKLHSGTLDIASTEGVGTVVSISIPILKEESEEPKEIIVK